MQRLIFSFAEHKAVYFRVTKVASSSLLIAFRKIDEVEKYEKYDKSYFKFAFVRNPFDRLASCFRHVIQKGTPETLESCPGMNRHMTFGEFVDSIRKIEVPKMDIHFRPQYTFIPEKPDFLGKFENLQEDYLEVCKRIGIKHAPELQHHNSTDRTRFNDYYSDSKILQKVVDCYKKDFELFGYDPSKRLK